MNCPPLLTASIYTHIEVLYQRRVLIKTHKMKKIALLLIVGLVQISLSAQNDVTIGKNKKFVSKLLGGEVTYSEQLPDGYDNTKID